MYFYEKNITPVNHFVTAFLLLQITCVKICFTTTPNCTGNLNERESGQTSTT